MMKFEKAKLAQSIVKRNEVMQHGQKIFFVAKLKKSPTQIYCTCSFYFP